MAESREILHSPLLVPRTKGKRALAFRLHRLRAPSQQQSVRLQVPPPKGQSQADLQATMFAHMEGFAGRLATLEVSGVAPIPAPCSSVPVMLGMHVASRKSGRPAPHEGRTLLRAGACISRIRPRQTSLRFPIKKQRAFQPVPPRRGTCKVGISSGQSQRIRRGRAQLLGSHAQVQRILRTRHECPGVITAAREESAGGFDDPARQVLELAAARKGTLAPPLRPVSNITNGIPRRGENRRIRAPTRYDVPDLWGTRVRSEGQRPRFDLGVAPLVSQTPTPGQTSVGHPPKLHLSSPGTGKRPRSRRQRSN